MPTLLVYVCVCACVIITHVLLVNVPAVKPKDELRRTSRHDLVCELWLACIFVALLLSVDEVLRKMGKNKPKISAGDFLSTDITATLFCAGYWHTTTTSNKHDGCAISRIHDIEI